MAQKVFEKSYQDAVEFTNMKYLGGGRWRKKNSLIL